MPSVRCFLIVPTTRDRLRISRSTAYQFDPKTKRQREDICPVHKWWHHAEWVTLKTTIPHRKKRPVNRPPLEAFPPKRSKLWPTSCACGYSFTAKDEWQGFTDLLYSRYDQRDRPSKLRDRFALHEAPVGAMWYATWMEPVNPTPDGKMLVVKTPGGDWMVDFYSTGRGPNAQRGPAWTRTGDVLAGTVTAMPSVSIGDPERYHGWLRNGFLEDA